MPATPGAPTTELGTARGAFTRLLPSWSSLVEEVEHVPELMWPRSVQTFDRMRSDAQVAALLAGLTLPIRAYTWAIDPRAADATITANLAQDLGLPIVGNAAGQDRRLGGGRFDFDDHLRHGLLALAYGHYYFEQVGTIDDAGRFRYRKIAERIPSSIDAIEADPTGGLSAIKQGQTTIPVQRLVGYVWDREGGSWIGRSMLRPLYRSWVVKDRLIRVDAIKHERNGMGLPTIEAGPDATPAQMLELARMATAIRAGEQAGGALPNGAKLRLVGTEGSVPDTLASIRYHDEAMARAMLEMFMQLGTTQTGSRALGETMVDYVALAQQAVARWFAATFTAHVIEDYFDWNVGTDAPTPVLTFEPPADTRTSTSDLVALINAGAITVDPDLEDALRSREGLPVKPEGAAPTPPLAAHRHAVRAATRPRTFRRDLTPAEVQATTDFVLMAGRLEDRTAVLVRAWGGIRDQQINDLHAQIMAAAGDPVALAGIQPATAGADLILRETTRQATAAYSDARAELTRQGASLPDASVQPVLDRLAARADATAQIMATDLGQAASRNAVRLSGSATDPQDLADEVIAKLESLTDTYPRDMLGSALMAAENDARTTAMREVPPEQAQTFYASELLDDATCGPCADIDGTEYASLEEAEADYPTGGYYDCDGGPRCRGTIVAVMGELNDPTAAG